MEGGWNTHRWHNDGKECKHSAAIRCSSWVLLSVTVFLPRPGTGQATPKHGSGTPCSHINIPGTDDMKSATRNFNRSKQLFSIRVYTLIAAWIRCEAYDLGINRKYMASRAIL